MSDSSDTLWKVDFSAPDQWLAVAKEAAHTTPAKIFANYYKGPKGEEEDPVFALSKVEVLMQRLLTLCTQEIDSAVGELESVKEQASKTQADLAKSSVEATQVRQLQQALAKKTSECEHLEQELSQASEDAGHLKEHKGLLESAKSKIKQLEDKVKDVYHKVIPSKAVEDEAHKKVIARLPAMNKSAAKIQARIRGFLCRKRFFQMVENYVKGTRKISKKELSNETIMKQVSAAAKAKNLTLEQCYRAADADSDGLLTNEELTRFMNQVKLGLSPAQISRLMLILDEDCSGKVEIQEFYDALSAYQVASEHQRTSARSYGQETLVKFVSVLDTRGISPDELFNLCDTNGSGTINLAELEKFVQGLKMGFKDKEVHALMSLLDANHSGDLTKEEFAKHMDRGTQAFKLESAKSVASFGPPKRKVNTWMTQTSDTRQNEDLKAIVEKMESRGLNITDAFDKLETDRKGRISIAGLSRFMNKSFPQLSKEEILRISMALDLDKDAMLDAGELHQFLVTYSQSPKPSLRTTLSQIAVFIQRKQMTVASFLSKAGVVGVLEKGQFVSTVMKVFGVTQEQAEQVGDSLDLKNSGDVAAKDFISVLKTYLTDDQEQETPLFQTEEIKGDESAPDPRAAVAQTREDFLKCLEDNKLTPVHVYKLADKRNTGTVSVQDLKTAIAKLLPSASPSLIDRFIKTLPSPTIDKADFLDLFSPVQVTSKPADSRTQASVSTKPQAAAFTDNRGFTAEQVYWLKQLNQGMKTQGLSVSKAFETADTNHDNKVTLEELGEALKRIIPQAEVPQEDLEKILKAVDVNGNGTIEKSEFLLRVGQANNSDMPQARLDAYARTLGKPTSDPEAGPLISTRAKVSASVPAMVPEKSPGKVPVKVAQKVVITATAAVLPIRACVKAQKLIQLMQKFQKTLTAGVDNTLATMPSESLFSLNRFIKCFSIRGGLSETDCTEVFKALDTHAQSIIPHYFFQTVLNSFQSPQDFALFPIAKNEDCDAATRKAWSDLLRTKQAFDSSDVFGDLPLSSSLSVEWDSLLQKWAPSQTQKQLLQSSLSTLNDPSLYHLAAILSSYCDSIAINPHEVVYAGIHMAEINTDASEFFASRGISPIDVMDKGQFAERVAAELQWNSAEAEIVYDLVFGGESFPIYHFFTTLDMYRSTLDKGAVTRPLPVLPIKNGQKPAKTTAVFSKVAAATGGPITRLGVQFTSKLSEPDFSALLVKAAGLTPAEATLAFRELRFNPQTKTVNVYHLLTVLDTFVPQPLAMEFPKDVLAGLVKQIGKSNVLDWLSGKRISLEQVLRQTDLENQLRMDPESAGMVCQYLDPSNKGGIYGFELATLVDLYQAFRANLGSFPMQQNPSTPQQMRDMFTHISANLGDQHVFDYYVKRKGLQLSQRLDRPTAARVFKNEMSGEELALLFESAKLGKTPEILAYHFLTCAESYSTVPLSDSAELPEHEPLPEETSHTESLSEALVMIQRIPVRSSTPAFFESKGLQVDQVFDKRGLSLALQKVGNLHREVAEEIFAGLDEPSKGKVFGYQLYTFVDLHRSCLKEGDFAYDLPQLPFASKGHKTLSAPLKAIAQELDRNNVNSITFAGKAGFQPLQDLRLPEFSKLVNRMDPTRAKALFAELDFTQKNAVSCYQFLAVLETYRETVATQEEEEEKVAPAASKPVAAVASKPSPAKSKPDSPVREALLKLADYMNGANPRKKQLSGFDVFGLFDSNHDGKLTRAEFMRAVNNTKVTLTDQQLIGLQREADREKNDLIDYMEFAELIIEASPAKEEVPVRQPSKERRPVSDIRGLDVKFASLAEGSFDQAIYKIKLYVKSNAKSFAAIEDVFQQLDTEHVGSLGETEFSLAIERLKISLTPSQKSLLKSRADKNKDGRIDYMEFINFIYDYDFSTGLEESKVSESESMKLMQRTITKRESATDPVDDIENYQIDPEKDYFRKSNPNCTTILNNEISALKRCVELIRAAKGRPFKDVEFGQEYGPKSIYWKGTPPNSNFPPVEDLVWKSPKEWVQNEAFFTGHISANDVVQGSLGDCWFIGALSVLATRFHLVVGSVPRLDSVEKISQQHVPGLSTGVYPPIFHPFANKGLYVLRFFKDGQWRYVIVDDRLPVFMDGDQPQLVFGQCRDQNELWVPIIEKAYAKLHGCYEALGGGLIDDALVDMTGLVSYKVRLTGQGGMLSVPANQQAPLADELWNTLMRFHKDGTLMGCSIDGKGVESDVMANGENTGLLARHAYGIIDVLYIPNPKAHNTKKRHRLLRVRNPWGKREWLGKWSDKSPEMEEFMDLINAELARDHKEQARTGIDIKDSDDGTFFMCFKDWRSIFDNFYACIDFEENWSGVRFTDEWTKGTSGGVPTTSTKEVALRFARNPQFVTTLKRKTELYIALEQDDGRYQSGAVFPYEQYLHTACISMFSLKPNEDGIEIFDSTRIIKLSPLKLHREVDLKLELDPGKYVMIPATMNPGETGQFFLSVYFSCPKTDIDMYKRGDAENKGDVIEEEEEIDPETITEDIVNDLKRMVGFLLSLK